MLRRVLESRAALIVGVVVSLLVPAVTLPRLPHVSVWPVALGLVPWVVGKYLLCPLRWRAVTDAGLTRWWHLRAYAESELVGLFTPGHVGADLWRVRRLTRAGVARVDSVASVAVDRGLGAVGLASLVVFAGTALPLRTAVVAGLGGVAVTGALVAVRRLRPHLLPAPPLPAPRRIAFGLVMSIGYQLTIAVLLFGSLAATGHLVPPLALMGAFGASQLAGALPGPNGASPREGALVMGLVALGVPLTAAAAAVALKAALAWLPALTLGGVSLLVARMMPAGSPSR